ncbi:PorT family protein [Carboxylicivirga mesophila]|uniref:PorT family protein n=1 Tax=Carboxylicivirga mesophila TaxID=1166478 RepID=A0ABS5K675_9BACT|nr:porin family protein [Carboxylicivirga mesophila]MBS2210475.1 PorT family protein [Carboxylicivirga mesophila]
MKKAVLMLTLLAIVGMASAQDRFAIGLKTGFNTTKIKLSDIPENVEIKNEANNGFLFGAYGKLRLTESFSLQPEMYYAKKSSTMSIAEGDVRYPDSENTLHTWDIPILANLQLIDLKVVKIYGVAGPVASFIASSSTDLPEWDEFKSTNWTFQAGGGVEFWRLTADVRYEWGLSDISDLAQLKIGQKTDVLTFAVGFKLFGI